MGITSAIVDPILNFRGVPAYALIGSLAFAEAAVFAGFVLPGETAVILGGVLAYRHSVSLTAITLLVVAAAIAGDSVGYEVGKRYGARLLAHRIFDKHQAAIESGQERLRRLGGKAVFLARFTAFLRAVMPGMAGTARMPYRRFLVWNVAGGILWGVGFTLLGYFAGASYTSIERYAGWLSEAILGAIAVVFAGVMVRRHLQRKRAAPTG
ncbi:MAG: hypothetical protein JWN61_197 [Pseudonocardiales bacterium]|nr:hypothetical protein [Pseudonocardiales bacterium]